MKKATIMLEVTKDTLLCYPIFITKKEMKKVNTREKQLNFCELISETTTVSLMDFFKVYFKEKEERKQKRRKK